MIVVSGTIELDPSNHDDAAAKMQKLAAATNEEAGCVSYEFFADLSGKGRFRVFEEWQDQAAIDAHFQEPHMQEFLGAMGGLGVTGTDIHKYEVGEKSKLM